MRYLTKEWCQLCRLTDMHFGLQAHKDAETLNESVYEQLKNISTDAFLKQEKNSYDFDPRQLLTEKEKEDSSQLILAFDSRGPFDIQKSILKFEDILESRIKENEIKIPKEIYSQITDPRVFALGYSTESIINQLQNMSAKNEQKVQSVLRDFSLAMEEENIPADLKHRFGFHDCVVKRIEKKKNITIWLDSSSGFTDQNKIVFHDAEILQEDQDVEDCWWIYEELYKTENGYEAHMMLSGEMNSDIEFTITSKDITVDKV